jgi:hypothetical protein
MKMKSLDMFFSLARTLVVFVEEGWVYIAGIS